MSSFGPTKMEMPQASSNPSSPSAGDMYYNTTDNEVRLYNGTDWVKVDASATYNYARYLVGATVNGHHPRVSRLYVIDASENKHTVQSYASDNCSDTGGIPSQGSSFTFDSTSNPRSFIGIGGYVSFAGARAAQVTLQVSQDNSTYISLGTVTFTASTCGEKEFFV